MSPHSPFASFSYSFHKQHVSLKSENKKLSWKGNINLFYVSYSGFFLSNNVALILGKVAFLTTEKVSLVPAI